MWTLKMEVDIVNAGLFGPLAIEHNTRIFLNPLCQTQQGTQLDIHISGTCEGKNTKRFLSALRKDPRIQKMEQTDNFFLCLVRGFEEYQAFFNPEIIHFEPWFIDGSKKMHLLHLGSWDRNNLSTIITMLGNTDRVRILRFENRPATNFFLASMRPQLTDKQRDALQLAISKGYYDYPRKTSVKQLAVESGCAFATFQAHLRKAERKMLPFSPAAPDNA